MKQIKLPNGIWVYDPAAPLGTPGGFGAVYAGRSSTGEEVAVKKLHISSAATGNRELVISTELAGKNLSNVIPFYDSGIDADTLEYFVVMARAQKALQQVVDGGFSSEDITVKILTDIAHGLQDVGDIVHRDLKPGNVLYHENRWKLADFGIARFVEDSTSINTLKDCLSPLYAAPEQWRLERASKATDIYAFGCIAYALLTGQPPFTSGDLRSRHLNEDLKNIPGTSRMQQLISLCLRKSPNARPSVSSVFTQLEALATSSIAHAGIASAGAAIAVEQAKNEAELSRRRTEEEGRRELAGDAIKSLNFILESMFEAVERDAKVAQRISNGIVLGHGSLTVRILFTLLPKDAFVHSKRDVICGALISVEQEAKYYRGRSANLWFGDFGGGEYRWWEFSYFTWSHDSVSHLVPFGISSQHQIQDADYAAAPIMHTVQHATTPVLIDGEHMDAFIKRWLSRLAAASTNSLQQSNTLPES